MAYIKLFNKSNAFRVAICKKKPETSIFCQSELSQSFIQPIKLTIDRICDLTLWLKSIDKFESYNFRIQQNEQINTKLSQIRIIYRYNHYYNGQIEIFNLDD
ncbi:hypothetical protein DERP_000310 [Dermatophagoides pteronyssinus]|uniref:Uncharacterized protein n=1 Tax=Dermatophagoides pteronyssinus TaxID=6956 RepID=A0ABQ8IZW5_DERPT|nr:hypothetical protein DERP_000310 [Dermatophagoides pteronyssinus]